MVYEFISLDVEVLFILLSLLNFEHRNTSGHARIVFTFLCWRERV